LEKRCQLHPKQQQSNQKTALDQIKVNLSRESKPGDLDVPIDQATPPTVPNAGLAQHTKASGSGNRLISPKALTGQSVPTLVLNHMADMQKFSSKVRGGNIRTCANPSTNVEMRTSLRVDMNAPTPQEQTQQEKLTAPETRM